MYDIQSKPCSCLFSIQTKKHVKYHADAQKLPNGIFNLSSLLGTEKKLAINSLAPVDCRAQINLVIENVTPGSYQLEFSELNSFPEGTMLYLQDNFLQQSFQVDNEFRYSFTITNDQSSFGVARFSLLLEAPPKSIHIQVEQTTLTIPFANGIQWYFNGEAVTGATSPIFEATESGLYEVWVSVEGCTYVGKTELLITSIEPYLNELKVYPNPVKDELIIEFPAADQTTSLVMLNMLGQVCGSISLHKNSTIDMRNLPGGVYTLKLTHGNQIITRRIVKK